MYNYNRFQVCRFGLDGTLIHPKTHETRSIREDILITLRNMERYGEALSSLPALEHLCDTTHQGSDAHFPRQEFAGAGSAEGVVDAAIQRFRGGV